MMLFVGNEDKGFFAEEVAKVLQSENKDTLQKLAIKLQSKGKLNSNEIRKICGIGDNS